MDTEFLSESGRKAKRNILFVAAISVALGLGLVSPAAGKATLNLSGLGLETSLEFILWALVAAQIYNIFSFWAIVRYLGALENFRTTKIPDQEIGKPAGQRDRIVEAIFRRENILNPSWIGVAEIGLPSILALAGVAAAVSKIT